VWTVEWPAAPTLLATSIYGGHMFGGVPCVTPVHQFDRIASLRFTAGAAIRD